jgi:hypothetical protein
VNVKLEVSGQLKSFTVCCWLGDFIFWPLLWIHSSETFLLSFYDRYSGQTWWYIYVGVVKYVSENAVILLILITNAKEWYLLLMNRRVLLVVNSTLFSTWLSPPHHHHKYTLSYHQYPFQTLTKELCRSCHWREE